MEEQNNQIKIKLTTLMILIVIVAIIIVGILAIMLYNPDGGSNNNVGANMIVQTGEEENIIIEDGDEEPNPQQDYADTDFSFKFLKMENKNQNMIYSPLSIKYALKMLNEGANGTTKSQIENVIANLNLTKYNNIDNILSLANGIYVRNTYTEYVKEEFKQVLTEKYNAEINYDSFDNANNINKWIEDKTLGIIKNMIKDETVQNPYTEMLLINALAIDMEWKNSFDASRTYGEEFNLEDGSKMTATMMHQETKSDSVSYYKDENVTALAMDLEEYDDIQLEFIAIMPENNLTDYIEKFTIEDFNKIINESTLASKTKDGVNISIPKFSFDYELNLRGDLIKLGITDAFNKITADFSNMSSSIEGLYVSDALHKANVDFTEKGIKAAAVTVFVMADKNMIEEPRQPEEIKIDKPFLYIIRDKDTDEIWFVGTVYEPNSWENDKAEYQYR